MLATDASGKAPKVSPSHLGRLSYVYVRQAAARQVRRNPEAGWVIRDLEAESLPRFALGRVGRPEETARLVTLLAGEDASCGFQANHQLGGRVPLTYQGTRPHHLGHEPAREPAQAVTGRQASRVSALLLVESLAGLHRAGLSTPSRLCGFWGER